MAQSSIAKLERLHNYPTRYELVISNGEQSYRIAYLHRQSKHTLFQAVCAVGEQLALLTGDEEIHFGNRAHDGGTMGAWRIHWSGRTQREAIAAGELEWVGKLPKTAPLP